MLLDALLQVSPFLLSPERLSRREVSDFTRLVIFMGDVWHRNNDVVKPKVHMLSRCPTALSLPDSIVVWVPTTSPPWRAPTTTSTSPSSATPTAAVISLSRSVERRVILVSVASPVLHQVEFLLLPPLVCAPNVDTPPLRQVPEPWTATSMHSSVNLSYTSDYIYAIAHMHCFFLYLSQ